MAPVSAPDGTTQNGFCETEADCLSALGSVRRTMHCVHAQIIRQLLPVERDVEHIHPRMHGFGGKLEQKALPNGVRGDVADFLGHH